MAETANIAKMAEQVSNELFADFNWERTGEANTSAPEIRYIPAIIRFLGYSPLARANSLAEQLILRRTTLGMTQKEAARELDVDQGTLAKWEQGKREPQGAFLPLVKRFLLAESASGPRRAG
jgi:hypothetical protein